jgi:outer membrane protein assembly factor BamB
MRTLFLALVLTSGASLSWADTAYWNQFRGPNGQGISVDGDPPITFGPEEAVAWKADIPSGHSSPVAWGDRVFLTAFAHGQLQTICLDFTTGAVLWTRNAPAVDIEPVHPYNSPASSTPVTDGRRVYAYFGSYGVIAYDFNGGEVWRKPLPTPPTQFGTASSPVLVGNRLIIQRDGNSTDSQVIALNVDTGAEEWSAARPLMRESWSTPMIWNQDGTGALIVLGHGRVHAYDPQTGAERWSSTGVTFQPINVPIDGGPLLFVSSVGTGSPADPLGIPTWESLIQDYDTDSDGRLTLDEVPDDVGIHLRSEVPREAPGNFLSLRELMRHFVDADKDGYATAEEWKATMDFVTANRDTLMAIRPGGRGDVSDSHIAWRAEIGLSEMPSPLFYQGRLYLVRNGGVVTAYGSSGERLFRERLTPGGQYAASPVAAAGRIYAASDAGTIVVFSAGEKLEVLARNELGEGVTATPAIVGRHLLVRTERQLWAFGPQIE